MGISEEPTEARLVDFKEYFLEKIRSGCRTARTQHP